MNANFVFQHRVEMVRLPLKKQLEINSTPFKPNFKIRRKKDLNTCLQRDKKQKAGVEYNKNERT